HRQHNEIVRKKGLVGTACPRVFGRRVGGGIADFWTTSRKRLNLAAMVCARSAMAALVLLGASSDGQGPQGPRYPDLSSFCDARASAECNAEVILACASPNATMCVAKRQLVCVSSMPAGTTYNPSNADGCISQVSNAYADARITPDESSA